MDQAAFCEGPPRDMDSRVHHRAISAYSYSKTLCPMGSSRSSSTGACALWRKEREASASNPMKSLESGWTLPEIGGNRASREQLGRRFFLIDGLAPATSDITELAMQMNQ